MIRLIPVLLFGLLLLNTSVLAAQDEAKQTVPAAQKADIASPQNTEKTVNQNVGKETPLADEEPINEEDITKDFNFTDTSYLTDEQLQEAKEIDQIEEKTSFTSKIINSGHFTSETATKTYIPINKILE